MDVADIFVSLTASKQPVRCVAKNIIVSASRECVLDGVMIVIGPKRFKKIMKQ
jgi:hypothetical protein